MGFIDTVMPYARQVAEKTGLDPSWIVSQWHLETGGKIPSNMNLGGIQTGFASYSKYGSPGGLYMSYPSLDYFAKDYVNFINGKTYREAGVFQSQSVGDFFTALKTGGYATDPNYIAKGVARYNSIFPGESDTSAPVVSGGEIRNWNPTTVQKIQGFLSSFGIGGNKPGDVPIKEEIAARKWAGLPTEELEKAYANSPTGQGINTSGLSTKAIKFVVFILLFIFIGVTLLQLFPSPKLSLERS